MTFHRNAKLGLAGRYALVPAPPLASPARGGARGADLRVPARYGLGATPGRRRYRLRALDRLEGARAGGYLTAAASRT
jgi:hypothetical protein